MSTARCSYCGGSAVLRCGNCNSYTTCLKCAKKLDGGGMFKKPLCPNCGARNWKDLDGNPV